MAVTSGVHKVDDVPKAMMAGAQVAMMTSAVLKHGIGHFTRVLHDITDWTEAHEYESMHQMRGSLSTRSVADTAAFERINYMKVLSTYALRDVGSGSMAMRNGLFRVLAIILKRYFDCPGETETVLRPGWAFVPGLTAPEMAEFDTQQVTCT